MGLLKEELRRLGSLILQCADATRVEAGGALAVDRHGFARMVTEQIRSHPHITVVPGEVTEIPEGEVVIASGPLTSDALAERLQSLLGAPSTSTTRRPPWSPPRAWTWTRPGSAPGMTGERRTMSTAP